MGSEKFRGCRPGRDICDETGPCSEAFYPSNVVDGVVMRRLAEQLVSSSPGFRVVVESFHSSII